MAGGLQHITSSWQQAIKTLMLRNNLNIFIMNKMILQRIFH